MINDVIISIKLKTNGLWYWIGPLTTEHTDLVESSFEIYSDIKKARHFSYSSIELMKKIDMHYWRNIDEAKYYLISDDLITIFSIKRNPHLLKLKKEKFCIYKKEIIKSRKNINKFKKKYS